LDTHYHTTAASPACDSGARAQQRAEAAEAWAERAAGQAAGCAYHSLHPRLVSRRNTYGCRHFRSQGLVTYFNSLRCLFAQICLIACLVSLVDNSFQLHLSRKRDDVKSVIYIIVSDFIFSLHVLIFPIADIVFTNFYCELQDFNGYWGILFLAL
jgi:hypothetical protein